MRTLVDIPDQQLDELSVICDIKKMSRAEAIQQAISSYIEKNKSCGGEAFGLWKKAKIDGLKYQKKVRSEW